MGDEPRPAMSCSGVFSSSPKICGSLRRVNQTLKRANSAPDLCRLVAAGFPAAYAEMKHPRRRVINLECGPRPLAATDAFRRIANLPVGALNRPDRRNGANPFHSP